MKRSTLSATVAVLAAGCATAPPLPPTLDPGPDARLAATLSATGVQIYECRAGTAGVTPAWAVVAPQAELLDGSRRRVGDHGAGPYWALADGSRIVGSVRARVDAPRADAIAWLLLDTRSTGDAGRLAGVHRVQRVQTKGGMAPSGGCDAQGIGQQQRVPYRADYRFFVPASSGLAFHQPGETS